ncbi:MAG: hypothetical protein IJ800_06110 [Clostridia bacterium]|nr:hypothetical protein [Clostridia bacterium]
MAKKKGLIARLIDGPERSETYARSTLPTNRWELGWDVFKNNLGKLFGLNWLTLLFFIPLIAIFLLRYLMQTYQISVYPFAQNLGGGYPYYPGTVALESQLTLSLNQETFKYIIIGVIVAAVGLSGGMQVVKNMVWAEGVMIGADFRKGIKQNFFVVLFSLVFYTVIMVLSVLSVNMASVLIDGRVGVKWLLIVMQVFSYVVMVFATIMLLYMLSLGVTYKLKFLHLIKNAFILTIALFPLNLFFALFALVWFLLLFSGISILVTIGVILCGIWGFSLFMLVWTDYSQWVFDKYINDKVPGAKKNRGIYKPVSASDDDGESMAIEKSKYSSRAVKPITDYEVELYELPATFSRKDLEKLEETKEAMRKDSDKYAEEHKNDGENQPATFEDLLKEQEGDGADENATNSDGNENE